ncbi:hypothetical protein BC830DRAFT_596941 [Chytriomyces sp. MP71]|nr:hypothetical protein BC830DRAFT_596941 [Chytriomyces sp. MP71]
MTENGEGIWEINYVSSRITKRFCKQESLSLLAAPSLHANFAHLSDATEFGMTSGSADCATLAQTSISSLPVFNTSNCCLQDTPFIHCKSNDITFLSLPSQPLVDLNLTQVASSLTSLYYLDLSFDNLTGAIPTVFSNQLAHLAINNNALTGAIPTELGSLKNLQFLGVSGNKLEGSIPTELGNALGIEILGLHRNSLEGTIPTEIGSLLNTREINAFNNLLTGSIPTEIGKLQQITWLALFNNSLESGIPTELGRLSRITHLDLHANRLNGAIPTEFGLMKSLQYLDLSDNFLTGSIPTEFANLKALRFLQLSSNLLTGNVPYLPFVNMHVSFNCFQDGSIARNANCNSTSTFLPSFQTSAQNNTTLIVGIVLGILAVLIVIVCFWFQRKRSSTAALPPLLRFASLTTWYPAIESPEDAGKTVIQLDKEGIHAATDYTEQCPRTEAQQLPAKPSIMEAYRTPQHLPSQDSLSIFTDVERNLHDEDSLKRGWSSTSQTSVVQETLCLGGKASLYLAKLASSSSLSIDSNPRDWTVEQVAVWASNINEVGEIVVPQIVRNRVDGRALFLLSDRNMFATVLGLRLVGHQLSFESAVLELRRKADVPPPLEHMEEASPPEYKV